mgnify:CR=1 FL=1|jgi:hypothetical protein
MNADWERGYAAGYHAAHRTDVRDITSDRGESAPARKAPKPKRKASAYSKRYGAIYKRLKKKHPRMSFGALSKKAHKEARRKR